MLTPTVATLAGVKEMPYFLRLFGYACPTVADPGKFCLSTQRSSLITSILSAGTFFGAL